MSLGASMFETKVIVHAYQIQQLESHEWHARSMFRIDRTHRHGAHGFGHALEGPLGGCPSRFGFVVFIFLFLHKHGVDLRHGEILDGQSGILVLNVPPGKERSFAAVSGRLLVFNANSPVKAFRAEMVNVA
jgi:hypothetical protein